MNKRKSVWQIEEVAKAFLEEERGALPGEELQSVIVDKITQLWCDNPSKILDLGCGNGILGRLLLEKFPSSCGVFVDFSDAMLKAAREKLSNYPESIVLKADFAFPKWLDSVALYKPFDIVISGFAIHHQPDKRKIELYSEIYNFLSPGGIFLNLEHVASSTPAVEKLFDEFYIDHLHSFCAKSDTNISRESVAQNHKNRADKEEDVLTLVDKQCRWLREIGFSDVDCFYKIFEISLFGGRKTKNGA